MTSPMIPFGTKVIIDGEMQAIVTGHLFRPGSQEIECSWWLNGDLKAAWLPAWRVKAEEPTGS